VSDSKSLPCSYVLQNESGTQTQPWRASQDSCCVNLSGLLFPISSSEKWNFSWTNKWICK